MYERLYWVLLPPCKQALSVHIPLRDKLLLSYTRLLARSALKTKPKTMASSETQGQIVGARESLNRRENMAQEKSKER